MAKAHQASSRMPVFASIEEEAAFWDSHGTAEFEDEWEPVEVEIAPDLHSIRRMTVDVPYDAYRRLRDLSQARGPSAADLARARILDELARAEAAAGAEPVAKGGRDR